MPTKSVVLPSIPVQARSPSAWSWQSGRRLQLYPRLRGEDDQRVNGWLQKKTNKYTSGEAQNELLKVMAHQVLRKIIGRLQSSDFFTVMADETTDISNREQLVICLRWVDNDLDVHEEFVGLHVVDSIDANMLVAVIKDVLLRFNLSLSRMGLLVWPE